MQKKSLIYKEFINTLTSYYSIMLNISTKKKKYTPLFQQIDNKLVASQNKKQKTKTKQNKKQKQKQTKIYMTKNC